MDNFLVVFIMVPVQLPLEDAGLVVGGLVADRLAVGGLVLLVLLGLLCQLLQLLLHLTVENEEHLEKCMRLGHLISFSRAVS